MKKLSILILILFVDIHSFAKNKVDEQKDAVYAMIKRIVPNHAQYFEIKFIPKDGEKDVFELKSKNGKILLSGNNGVSIASSLNYYLKNYAHCSITWNGTNLKLPVHLPPVEKKLRISSPYKYRYYLNYCTFNYSLSWWDWKRWQWEIDWMALNGINMPLAITGQNAIWDRVYKNLNFTQADMDGFFSGPAYFNWFYMGNLDAWGGPLPQSIIKGHEDLQKKILTQERAFGMTPILPSFTGHVPPSFKNRYPNAKLKQTHWTTFPDVYILDPNDPMFTKIGKEFLKEQIKTFGTDHLYTADTFNENTPPTKDSTYLNDVSKKVFQSMVEVDPDAKWIMQGWLFYHAEKFWKPTQIKALLNAVPDDKMIILDLWTENHPVWDRTEAYYGKPWIWCMLHNFGGNISMYGRMDDVATIPLKTLKNPKSGKMLGIGLTPEAIEQNPVIYEMMLENVWRNTPVNVDEWLKNYAWRRYGAKNKFANEAWRILRKTVYTGRNLQAGAESIITSRPTLVPKESGTHPHKNYRPKDLIPAWENLILASAQLKNNDGFQYDLVDVTRQALVNYADTLQYQFAIAFKSKDIDKFNRLSHKFVQLMEDVDRLLATRRDFLLGKWISDARKWGANDEEKKLFERNAKNLISLWGDEKSTLNEYSCRQWSGMISGFYSPRWVKYFTYLNTQLRAKKEINQAAFEIEIKKWEWNWVNSNEKYADKPIGNSVLTANSLFQKYNKEIKLTFN